MNARPPVLFKYRPLTTYVLRGLATSSLWQATPDQLNDPFDTSVLISPSNDTDQIEWLMSLAPDHMTADLPVREAPTDENINRLRERAYSYQRNQIRICSMTSVDPYDPELGPRMWAQYASGYSGLCLEFDAAQVPFFHAKEVKYDLVERATHLGQFSDPLEKLRESVFWKSPSWAPEQEWRVADTGGNTLLYYDPDALKKVWFGPRLDLDDGLVVAALLAIVSPSCEVWTLSIDPKGVRLQMSEPQSPEEWVAQNRKNHAQMAFVDEFLSKALKTRL